MTQMSPSLPDHIPPLVSRVRKNKNEWVLPQWINPLISTSSRIGLYRFMPPLENAQNKYQQWYLQSPIRMEKPILHTSLGVV